VTAEFVRIARQLFLNWRQGVGISHVGDGVVVVARVERNGERRERFEQDLVVLPSRDLPSGKCAAVAYHVNVEVDRFAGITGPHVVDVHAVGRAAGRRQACRHKRLPGDVTPDDMVHRIVELGGDEVVVVDPVDHQRGDDVGQGRRSVRHPRIMPQRSNAERSGR